MGEAGGGPGKSKPVESYLAWGFNLFGPRGAPSTVAGMPPPTTDKTEPAEAILHDLGAPLTAARGWSELLCDAGLEGKRGEWAGKVRDCLAEMARILTGSATREAFCPVEEIEELADSLGRRARETGTCFLCGQRGPGPWRVEGDRGAFRRIAANLMSNVLRHAPGGEVEVEVVLRRAPRGWRLRLEVADEGPGLGRRAAESLFRAGERGRDSPGKGLGLHIVRELAKANGGEAGARAEARGARFWAEMLVTAAAGAEPLPSRRRPVLMMMGPGRRRRWLARLLTGWRMPCAVVPENATDAQLARASRGLGGGSLVVAEQERIGPPRGTMGWVCLAADEGCGPMALLRALEEGQGSPRLAKGRRTASLRMTDAKDKGQAPA